MEATVELGLLASDNQVKMIEAVLTQASVASLLFRPTWFDRSIWSGRDRLRQFSLTASLSASKRTWQLCCGMDKRLKLKLMLRMSSLSLA
jgi:hypothetical protein